MKNKLGKKHPGGRPPITLKDLPDNWQDLILQMSAKGLSDVEIRAELCMSGKGKSRRFNIGVWYALKEREPEFLETIKIGKEICQAWWLSIARQKLYHGKGTTFETGSWYANMKNRFGWHDTQRNLNLNGSADDPAFRDEFFGFGSKGNKKASGTGAAKS